MAALERYPWPGNVRELQNIVERACALARASASRARTCRLTCSSGLRPARTGAGRPPLPSREVAGASGPTPTLREAKERWLQDLEGAYLRDLLAQQGGNISAAAKIAGIDRKTFHRLLNRYGVR